MTWSFENTVAQKLSCRKRHRQRLSRGKTKLMPCPEKYQYIYIEGKEVKTVETFKYLDSLVDANGRAETDVKKT